MNSGFDQDPSANSTNPNATLLMKVGVVMFIIATLTSLWRESGDGPDFGWWNVLPHAVGLACFGLSFWRRRRPENGRRS